MANEYSRLTGEGNSGGALRSPVKLGGVSSRAAGMSLT